MKIRSKITLFLGPFVLAVLTLFFVIHYYLARQILLENAQSELIKTEQNMHRSVQVLLSTAIKSYLRGITEKNIDFIKNKYNQYRLGLLTEPEAKKQIQEHFNLQKVGTSGYLVTVKIAEDKLFLDLHPFLPSTECTSTEGCQEWNKVQNGYTEYNWKNPADNSFRKKAAYVQEFKPWNWIVGASSYRDEFVKLVDIEDLRNLISPVTIKQTGYFFVFDDNDTLLIHPEPSILGKQSLINSKGENVLALLKEKEQGYLTYMWKNPSEREDRLKYAIIDKLEDYNWYLVASGYLNEVYEPIVLMKKVTLFMVLFTGTILFALILHLSKRLSSPILRLKNEVNRFYGNKQEILWENDELDEVNVLGKAFSSMTKELNRSMDQLKKSNRDLDKSKREQETSRLYYESIINSMPSLIIGVDPEFKITEWNSAAQKMKKMAAAEGIGVSFFEVFNEFEIHQPALLMSVTQNEIKTLSHSVVNETNKSIYMEITVYPLVTQQDKGAVIRIDMVTDRIEMEQRLRQSQKMDAVGQLAGGIAHDFNNILSGIVGSAELLRLNAPEEQHKLIKLIIQSSERAGDLIQKLLRFSRKDAISFAPLDFHSVIEDTIKILNHTLDKRILISQNLDAQFSIIEGDWSSLESGLLNIGINGGQAMVNGGKLTFTTSNLTFSHEGEINGKQNLAPGEYIQLNITDTGSGIDDETLKHIFEPFFTTKRQGEGTGLGLAAAYGAIQQHSGLISVESKINNGTCFTIFLPLTDQTQEIPEQLPSEFTTGQGCILIIDDEQIIRETAKLMLQKLGYTILEAENGQKGIEVFRQKKSQIDLVILDMVMPVMDGTECFEHLKEIDSDVKVLISSGYTRDADLSTFRKMGLKGFIRKPHNMIELSEAVARGING